jgi:Protein of unknown function (DUF3605)
MAMGKRCHWYFAFDILQELPIDILRAAEGDLAKLTRLPSELAKYRVWCNKIKAEYGTVLTFLMQERLFWEPLPASDSGIAPTFAFKNPTPFADRSDYRIIVNDWPYGLVPGIKHICVWLKTPLPIDTTKGALTKEGTDMVNEFVRKTFEEPLGVVGKDKVVWFKNYWSTQSVRAIDHVHVLFRDIDDAELDPLIEKTTSVHE